MYKLHLEKYLHKNNLCFGGVTHLAFVYSGYGFHTYEIFQEIIGCQLLTLFDEALN